MALDTNFPRAPKYVGQQWEFLTDENLNDWVGTAIASGTASVIDTNSAGENGVVRFANAATTEDSGYQFQVDAECVQLDGAEEYGMVSRVRASDADQCDILIGFGITDTTLLGSAPSDGVYLLKADGSATVSLVVRSGSTTQQTESLDITLEDSTYIDLTLRIRNHSGAAADIEVYADGNLVETVSVTAMPTAEALTPSVAWLSGAPANQTFDWDYQSWFKSRS